VESGGIDRVGLALLRLLALPILILPVPELTLPTDPGAGALAVLAFIVLFPELVLPIDTESLIGVPAEF